LLAKKQNLSNQLDSLKDTNIRLIDYVKSINKKVGTANSGIEFSEITENNKSRISIRRPANLHTKICLKKKDKKLKICYFFGKNLMLARALKGN
jgi:hypothetical protein